MSTKLLSIRFTFRGLKFGNFKWILIIIRYNLKRDKKRSIIYITRLGKLVINGFNTL
jgi:hypothetical protein